MCIEPHQCAHFWRSVMCTSRVIQTWGKCLVFLSPKARHVFAYSENRHILCFVEQRSPPPLSPQ